VIRCSSGRIDYGPTKQYRTISEPLRLRGRSKERHRSVQARKLEARLEGAVASANEDSIRIESKGSIPDSLVVAFFWYRFCWRGLLLRVLAIFGFRSEQSQPRGFECFLRPIVSLRRSRGTKEELVYHGEKRRSLEER